MARTMTDESWARLCSTLRLHGRLGHRCHHSYPPLQQNHLANCHQADVFFFRCFATPASTYSALMSFQDVRNPGDSNFKFHKSSSYRYYFVVIRCGSSPCTLGRVSLLKLILKDDLYSVESTLSLHGQISLEEEGDSHAPHNPFSADHSIPPHPLLMGHTGSFGKGLSYDHCECFV
jgi:hypothetical protein